MHILALALRSSELETLERGAQKSVFNKPSRLESIGNRADHVEERIRELKDKSGSDTGKRRKRIKS